MSTPERTKLSHTLGRALADLLRSRNHQNGVAVAYKAFYHRLARRRFATFMRGMLARMLDQVRVQSLTPDGQTAVARFADIVIHHGSSFALKAALSGTCPGQFTTAAHSGSFIVRLTRSYDPSIRTAWVEGQRPPVPTRLRVSRFLAQHVGQRLDLDGDFPVGPRVVGVRVVVLPGREAAMTRLCTNLPRTPFSLDLVARLYRFRWQIERCFKKWTSYANRHQFDTANAHIAEGLIWASLVAAVLLGAGLRGTLRRGLTFLLANARRANPERDRRIGRLRTGLGRAVSASVITYEDTLAGVGS